MLFMVIRSSPPLSFRTKQSVVKNLGDTLVSILVDATEILRFALNDKVRSE